MQHKLSQCSAFCITGIDHGAPNVFDQQMALLNACRLRVLNRHRVVAQGLQQAAISSKKPNTDEPQIFGGHDSVQHVLAVATGGDGDQTVSRLGQGLQLPGEYLLKSKVIADGR